jgi:hypothetical protein
MLEREQNESVDCLCKAIEQGTEIGTEGTEDGEAKRAQWHCYH